MRQTSKKWKTLNECVITEQDRQDYVKYRSTAYLSKG